MNRVATVLALVTAIMTLAAVNGEPQPFGSTTMTVDGSAQTCPVFTAYGSVTPSGNSLTLPYNVRAYYMKPNSGSTFYKTNYNPLMLLGKTLSFTVDMSGGDVGAGCNAAVYLVNMPGSNPAGLGDYYCDGSVNAQPCGEMDLFEGNRIAMATTPHRCSGSWCDHDGCGINSRNTGNWFGSGSGYTINSQQPFTLSFTFNANGNTLTGISFTASQGGRTVSKPYDTCHGDNGDYFNQFSNAFTSPLVLVVSYWGVTSPGDMAWLDGVAGATCQSHAAWTVRDIVISGGGGGDPVPPCTGSVSVLSGTDLTGHDVANAPGSNINDCITQCQSKSSCNAVTLSGGVCYFKSSPTTKSGNAACTSAICISQGIPPCTGSVNVLSGLDLVGHDVSNAAGSNINDCIAQCRTKSSCNAVTLSAGVCYFKSSPTNSIASSTCTSATCISQGGSCSSMTQLPVVDLYGGDLSKVTVGTMDACIAQCQGTSGCQAVTYSGGVCYMKTAAALSDQRSCAGCVSAYCSGVNHCPNWVTAANTDLNGGDIAKPAGSSIADCQTQCAANPQCVSATLYQGVCYLKDGTSLAHQQHCDGCVCGKCGGNLTPS